MKNFNQIVKYEHLKYITIVYPVTLESIKLMVQEHYNNKNYDDTLFLINTCYSGDIDLNKPEFNHKRCIYYNFEHSDDLKLSQREDVQNYLKNNKVTEVWSMEPNNELFDGDLGVKYMPVRYTSLIKKNEYTREPLFDLGFIGIVGSNDYSPRRNNFFGEYILDKDLDFSIKIMNGYSISELKDELSNCRFILDSHRTYLDNMQNQVRIFEHICLGHTVLSEKSDYNIFPRLIYEWENIKELNYLIKTIKPQDFSEAYKEMTYTNDVYENYRNSILYWVYEKWVHEYFDKCNIKRYDLINKLIKRFNYKSYLEIGVKDGENFDKINCENKTSVDPEQLGYTTYQMTSDDYFAQLSEDIKFDIIFIDGMHLWEYCYRDINNALKHLSPNGIILCHDMNPLYEMNNTRNCMCSGGLWNGDVWKAFVKIRSERSDIYTCMIEDCDFGIGVIAFGQQEVINLDTPIDRLTYKNDFTKNKPYLMNTVKIEDFIARNNL